MKIAVTGASGYIGHAVIKQLISQSADVIAVTRSKNNLSDFEKKIEIVEYDLSSDAQGCFKKIGSPDCLLHLAWNGLPHYNSLHHFENELPIQYNFLKKLIAEGLTSLVVSGTCFEYGSISGCLNEDSATNPITAYGFGKDALRRKLEFLKKNYDFSFTWARIFYTYGAGQASSALYTQLLNAIIENETIFKMSGGQQKRDYLPVEDVAKGLIFLAENKSNIGVVNICSGLPISIHDIVKLWIKNNNWKINLDLGHYPYCEWEPMAFWGDNSKFQKFKDTL